MFKLNLFCCIFTFLITVHLITFGTCAHITGTFRPNDFFKFIIKFGFQKTERHSQRDSFGYIYGNITSRDQYPVPITLAVLDKTHFLQYYGNRSIVDKEVACQKMFQHLNNYSYDRKCNPHATGDYLRKIPCRVGELCPDEDMPSNVIANNQFTYVISDLTQPRFWYVSMVACYRNVTSCQWHHYDYRDHLKNDSTATFNIDYDFRLVNGNPNQSSAINSFTFNFSFEQQNILEMNIIFFIIYLIMVPMQTYAVRIQKHPVTKLFTISLILEFISLCFILTYSIRFSISGIGNETFKTTGDIFDILSRTSFMLILLLLAKGWAVTRQQISRTGWLILMAIWIPYCAFHMVLYVWNRTEVDIISDIDEYQTWPGWLVLACRTCIMMWFLWELRNTMKYEHSTKKLDFLLHFGASSLLWFIYLPVVAIVALQVSPMWRYKLLLGITNSADCLAYCVMTGLLWPNRAGQYLLLTGTNYGGMDELDEFNEAPHIVHDDNLLSPNSQSDPSSLDRRNVDYDNLKNSNNISGRSLDLLVVGDEDEDDDDDDAAENVNLDDNVVISTDDLLFVGNNTNQFNYNYRNVSDSNLLNLNTEQQAVELSKNSHIIA